MTDKPVKGMLTGPVTIRAWLPVRDGQPLGRYRQPGGAGDSRRDRGFAVRRHTAVIQVDEP